MNRDDYLRETVLVSALKKYDETVAKAEARALDDLNRRGFGFKRISDAREYKRLGDKARRANAELVAMRAAGITRRTK